MKILLINNFHYVKGGSEAVYFNMARMFTQAGHEVIFFSCKSDKNTAYGSNDHFVPLNSEVNPILGAFRYIYNGSAARSLDRLLRENRPDIAHIHLIWGGLSSSILGVLKRHKIPVVHTAHDFRMICPAYLLRRTDGTICNSCYGGNYLNCAKYRCSNGSFMRSLLMSTEFYLRNHIFHALDSIDGFVFVSRFSFEQHKLAMPKFGERKALIAYNAISDLPQEAISIKMGDYYLYFGRLSSEKGLTTLIAAFDALPTLKLKIVGTGPMAEQLQSTAPSNVEFCGYQSGDTLVLPADPTKDPDGNKIYTFTGWSPVVVTTVTADATYTAQFRESIQSTNDEYIPPESKNRAYLLYIEVGVILAVLIATPIVTVRLVKRHRRKKRANAEQTTDTDQ